MGKTKGVFYAFVGKATRNFFWPHFANWQNSVTPWIGRFGLKTSLYSPNRVALRGFSLKNLYRKDLAKWTRRAHFANETTKRGFRMGISLYKDIPPLRPLHTRQFGL